MVGLLRTSMGPKTSRAWKVGKTRRPKCMGRAVVLLKGGWAGMERAMGRAPRKEVRREVFMMAAKVRREALLCCLRGLG